MGKRPTIALAAMAIGMLVAAPAAAAPPSVVIDGSCGDTRDEMGQRVSSFMRSGSMDKVQAWLVERRTDTCQDLEPAPDDLGYDYDLTGLYRVWQVDTSGAERASD